MSDIERDIARLDSLLRKLELEYEQFLSGQLRREPSQTESALLFLIQSYSSRAIQPPALRFRYNSLVARYNSFRNVWTRRLREKDEGRVIGRPRKAPPSVPPPPRDEFITADPRRDTNNMQQIFDRYKQLRQQCGEKTDRLRLENFCGILAEKVESIKKSRNCDSVLIKLLRDQNKIRIVACPFRPSPEDKPT